MRTFYQEWLDKQTQNILDKSSKTLSSPALYLNFTTNREIIMFSSLLLLFDMMNRAFYIARDYLHYHIISWPFTFRFYVLLYFMRDYLRDANFTKNLMVCFNSTYIRDQWKNAIRTVSLRPGGDVCILSGIQWAHVIKTSFKLLKVRIACGLASYKNFFL